jgi:hypothetical protein
MLRKLFGRLVGDNELVRAPVGGNAESLTSPSTQILLPAVNLLRAIRPLSISLEAMLNL